MSPKKYMLPDTVKIELPSSLLAELICNGLIFGHDCKCLDENAKQVLWQSLLLSSTHRSR
ncbi:hypothetical protein [Thalassotalea atypica]|uniref:hypothetical protein n=1 Tax=Thalassotalea atypica TaxID=2054316 RepID=UPI0025741E53|nr:hypothetical protein [Thalassotalea atypica]